MAIVTGKIRVLIPTTAGAVEVQLLTEEEPIIGRCVVCIGGTTETADIAPGYHAFVVRPTGVVERLFGHSCYRLDVSGRIDAGSSWQLGVLMAHALHAVGRLALEGETADGVIWATGSVRAIDLTVGGVGHIPEKLANSIERLRSEARAGRRVVVAIPSENAAAFSASITADLHAYGIETTTVSDLQGLWDHFALKVPKSSKTVQPLSATSPPPQPARTKPGIWVGAALVCIALAGEGLFLMRPSSPPVEARDEPATPPVALREAEILLPENVPFASDRGRAAIRSVYLPAPDFKAIALSKQTMHFSTGQPDEQAARNDALTICEMIVKLRQGTSLCEIYAVGMHVVSARSHPPMPMQPWVLHNAAIERPFAADDIPFVAERSRRLLMAYPRARKPKALAISATGVYSVYVNQSGTDEAVRRSLERCGSNAGAACIILAVDDVFVLPIPKAAKIVGLAQPRTLNVIAPELRDEVARRLANALDGWNAVAVGASGQVGLSHSAESERAAIDAAIADCRRRDHDCRLAIIGPFLVDYSPQDPKPSETAAEAAQLIAALALAAPSLSAAERDDLARRYGSLREHKALAVPSTTGRAWRSGGWPTPEAAEEGALERCQVFRGTPCVLVAVDDQLQAVGDNGPPSPRDMARARYAGTFHPDQIPGVLPAVRSRSDLVRYQRAPGPKAIAYHPLGRLFAVLSAENQNSAETLALADCNNDPTRQDQGDPCQLYAAGDQVVLPRRLTQPLTP